MVKTTLLAVVFVIALSLSAVAANSNQAAVSLHRAGNPNAALPQFVDSPNPHPPALCHPCLFYGGDLNPSDLNAAGMSDENTLFVPASSTYGAVTIPDGITASVYGILINVQAQAAFDPMTASYDIRTNVTEGDGGRSVASGSGPAVVQATGRNFLGFNEYTIAVSWSTPVTLTPGTYWFNVEPNCTNTLDGSCYVFRQFVSNTTSLTNNVHGSWQPIHQMFLNSAHFEHTWANWCDPKLGFTAVQCAGMSFGLRGTK